MRPILLIAALGAALGCGSNRGPDQAGARIQDTTLTPGDTVAATDTLPRIRDSVTDSAGTD
jgi:hypothetical protein